MEQAVAKNGEFYIYLEQVDIVVPNTAKPIICSLIRIYSQYTTHVV
jgi:hypothetical protein